MLEDGYLHIEFGEVIFHGSIEDPDGGINPTKEPISELVKRSGVVHAVGSEYDGRARIKCGDGELLIRTPTRQAIADNDAEQITYARAIANNDKDALAGKYVIWITGEDGDYRGFVEDVDDQIVNYGGCHELHIEYLFDKSTIVIIAQTKKEAEDRLAAIQNASVSS